MCPAFESDPDRIQKNAQFWLTFDTEKIIQKIPPFLVVLIWSGVEQHSGTWFIK